MLRLVLFAVALWGASPVATHGGATPPCFGAAARDAALPCHDAVLDREVSPTPQRARMLANAPCTAVHSGVPSVCEFGAPAGVGQTVALIGDSHAAHWRAALAPVALAQGWHGVSLTRRGCPLSAVDPVLPASLLGDCLRWREAIPGWLSVHPEIGTVVVSEHRPPVLGGLVGEVGGYLKAWRSLPSSVRQIVVIRDTPKRPAATLHCVDAAIARHLPAGRRCAIPRRMALGIDPAAIAARRTRSPRVGLVDLTRFMCDAARCYPVVGGVLVEKDQTHLTPTFAATVAPYLAEDLARLPSVRGAARFRRRPW